MSALAAAVRFVAVSAAAYAACSAWPALVLLPAAAVSWVAGMLVGLGAADPPAIVDATVVYARTGSPLVLEDPYVIAGIPLYLGLWAIPSRPARTFPWRPLVAGMLGFELLAGIVLALVALCVDRGFTTSPPREPIELVALVAVAAVRVLPLPLWMLLDPARTSLLALGRLAPEARRR